MLWSWDFITRIFKSNDLSAADAHRSGKILEKKSPALFIAMVCLSAVSNFYFFYIIGCNVIVYVLIRLFTRYGLRRWKSWWEI